MNNCPRLRFSKILWGTILEKNNFQNLRKSRSHFHQQICILTKKKRSRLRFFDRCRFLIEKKTKKNFFFDFLTIFLLFFGIFCGFGSKQHSKNTFRGGFWPILVGIQSIFRRSKKCSSSYTFLISQKSAKIWPKSDNPPKGDF